MYLVLNFKSEKNLKKIPENVKKTEGIWTDMKGVKSQKKILKKLEKQKGNLRKN